MKLPDTVSFTSRDKRRVATYMPLDWQDTVPPGLEKAKGPIYRLIRTVRTRRGFGTIIHSLTTFRTNKKAVHKSAAHWVKITNKDR